MPTEDHPVNQPLIPISIDDAIKKLYGPAIEEQLRHDLPLFNAISHGGPEPIMTPLSRWFHFKWELRHRINDIYMHARYGYCDDVREYDDHIC